MRKRKLIIHCSDSPYLNHDVEVIKRWHTDPTPDGRGWSDIGYHFVIERRDGFLQPGRDWTKKGAHTLGQNRELGLCLCGKSGKFRDVQMQTLEAFIILYGSYISEICQHSDFEPKKPFCAGLTESQMNYLNSLLG